MTEYTCRKCGWHLFESDATSGRLRVTCPNRRGLDGKPCKTSQLVFLGGRFSDRKPIPLPVRVAGG